MSRVENIAHQIKELLRDELTALREWFAAFDGDAWDRQMVAGINTGTLETLAKRALAKKVCRSVISSGACGIRTNDNGWWSGSRRQRSSCSALDCYRP